MSPLRLSSRAEETQRPLRISPASGEGPRAQQLRASMHPATADNPTPEELPFFRQLELWGYTLNSFTHGREHSLPVCSDPSPPSPLALHNVWFDSLHVPLRSGLPYPSTTCGSPSAGLCAFRFVACSILTSQTNSPMPTRSSFLLSMPRFKPAPASQCTDSVH